MTIFTTPSHNFQGASFFSMLILFCDIHCLITCSLCSNIFFYYMFITALLQAGPLRVHDHFYYIPADILPQAVSLFVLLYLSYFRKNSPFPGIF